MKHRPAFCRWQEVCLSSCRCSLGLANGCWLAVQTKALPIMTSSSYCLQIGASMSTPVDTLVPLYGYRLCLVSNAQMLKVANAWPPASPRNTSQKSKASGCLVVVNLKGTLHVQTAPKSPCRGSFKLLLGNHGCVQ